MKYQIVCKDTKMSPVVQEDIINRISRLEKMLFKSDEFDCRVVVKFRNNKSKVEITIPTPYLLLRSEVESFELVDAVDVAVKKLQAQITKVKAKLDRSKNKVNLGKTFGEAIESDKEEIIVKNKIISPVPMDVEDAIIQLDSLDHDFYVFEKSSDHKIAVVYKRKDGGYGLIDIK